MHKIFALFILTLSSSSKAMAIKLQEEDLPKLIEERNGNILSAKSEVEAGLAQQGHLARSFLPLLQINLGQEKTDGSPTSNVTNSYGYINATASLNLYNGGRDQLQEKYRKAAVYHSESELEDTKFDQLTQGRILFWNMVYQNEIITILKDALVLNDQNLRLVLKKLRSNLGTQTDEIDFNQSKIQLSLDLKKANIELLNDTREMASLLGHDPETVYDVPEFNTHVPGHPLDEFKTKDFSPEKHRAIKRIEALKTSAEYESEISSRWWTPQFDVYASKSGRLSKLEQTNTMDRDQGAVFGVKLTFLFDGLQSKATSVAQTYRQVSMTHLKNQKLKEIQSGHFKAYEIFKLNHDLIHSAEESYQLAKKYYDNTWSEYTRGIKNSPDVLQAFHRLVESKLRYADIKKNYQIAKAQIMDYLQE